MDENLVVKYQNIKNKVSQLEADKIKTKTELDIKEKELNDIVEKLSSLGITDLSKLDEIVNTKKQDFESRLNEIEEKLNGVQGSQSQSNF